jgi:threonine dehydrogenase-like Zn-dependent dehydrogenase
VAVYSRSPGHSEDNPIVRGIGARYIAAETHAVEQLPDLAGPIDVVYEATGASGLAFNVLKQLGPNGVVILTGVPGNRGLKEMDTDNIMRDVVLNNQAIIGSVNAPPHAFGRAIAHLGTFMERWPDAVRSIIWARFPIDQAIEPLKSLGGGTKSVVQVSS